MWRPTIYRAGQRRDAHGMALLAVLWLVAALSIMLSGMLHVVRGEVGIAGHVRETVVGNSLADAAIRLTLQALAIDKSGAGLSVQTRAMLVFGSEVTIDIIPLTGYVDLNSAPASLLADTFQYGGGVSQEAALRLATLVVQAREQKNAQGELARMHSVEELLGLSGLDYSIYARLKKVFTTDTIGSGRVNPLAAPLETLVILTKGDQSRARQLFESRLANPGSMDTTALTATHIEMVTTNYLAIRATLPLQADQRHVRTWSVDIASPAYGLPWRVQRVEQNVVTDVDRVN